MGDPKEDIIVAANIPLLGVSTAAAKMSMLAALGLSTITKSLNSKPILNLTVYDYLWGYDDPLISLASTIVPYIDFEKFGILDRMFDDGSNLVTINLPNSVTKTNYLEKIEKEREEKKSEVEMKPSSGYEYDSGFFGFGPRKIEKIPDEFQPQIRDYSIDEWNGTPGLKHWGYTNKK